MAKKIIIFFESLERHILGSIKELIQGAASNSLNSTNPTNTSLIEGNPLPVSKQQPSWKQTSDGLVGKNVSMSKLRKAATPKIPTPSQAKGENRNITSILPYHVDNNIQQATVKQLEIHTLKFVAGKQENKESKETNKKPNLKKLMHYHSRVNRVKSGKTLSKAVLPKKQNAKVKIIDTFIIGMKPPKGNRYLISKNNTNVIGAAENIKKLSSVIDEAGTTMVVKKVHTTDGEDYQSKLNRNGLILKAGKGFGKTQFISQPLIEELHGVDSLPGAGSSKLQKLNLNDVIEMIKKYFPSAYKNLNTEYVLKKLDDREYIENTTASRSDVYYFKHRSDMKKNIKVVINKYRI